MNNLDVMQQNDSVLHFYLHENVRLLFIHVIS